MRRWPPPPPYACGMTRTMTRATTVENVFLRIYVLLLEPVERYGGAPVFVWKRALRPPQPTGMFTILPSRNVFAPSRTTWCARDARQKKEGACHEQIGFSYPSGRCGRAGR